MSDAQTGQGAGWRMYTAIFALAVAIFTVLWFTVAALGTKFGLWPWQVGLGQMTIGVGPQLAMLAVALGLVAQILALIKAPRTQPFILALAATLIAALCLFRLSGFGGLAASLPPIHDVQTDWAEPIQFSETLMAERAADGETNPVLDAPTVPDYAEARWPGTQGRLVSELQAEAEAGPEGGEPVYPRIDPLWFDQDPAEIAALAERLAERRGWEIVTPADANAEPPLLVEATATSGWFGFKDDVAFRVSVENGVTNLDIRSTSRVGLSDLGANSKRVSGLLREMQDRGDGRWEP